IVVAGTLRFAHAQLWFHTSLRPSRRIQRQAITVTVNSMDVSRIVGIRFDLPPQSGNEIIDTASERDILVAPHIPQEFIAGYDFTGARAHVPQNFDFALAERDFLVITFRRVVIEVDVQRTERKPIIGWVKPSHDRLDARQKFIESEGFGDVVVGSKAQSLKLVFFLSPRGQNNDSSSRLFPVQLAADLKPIQTR